MSSVLRSAPLTLLAAVLSLAMSARPAASQEPHTDAQAPRTQASAPLKIGIIGTGHIGGALAALWVNAGHEVLMSSRHPQELQALAHSLGPKAHVGTPAEAARFGEVVLISVPYGALPQVGRDLKNELAGKIVLDTGNPYPERDGAMAVEARRKGTGVASAEYLPGVRLVRAFNAINSGDLRSEAHRKGAPIAIPLAGDDHEALQVAEQLVKDAGFAPVVVGPLAKAREFDVGTPVYTRLMTEPQLKAALGLK
ncbi:MAG: NAD(P)-binding domain-containing protein [Gammaproteobacteria bacterium]|nr:NAD(P)-binding domain-containing protein [Gammaproteobacteria bacterium]MBV9727163.1 NAD(P)-binding domain-containing protein [Gammaproteobacteria bacterium]